MLQLHMLAGLLAIVGGFFLYQAISYFRRAIVRPKVRGEVIRNRSFPAAGGLYDTCRVKEVDVEFARDNQRHRVTIETGSGVFPHYPVGSRVMLLVDECRQGQAEFFTKQEIALRIGLLFVGLAFAGVALLVWLGMYGVIEVHPVDHPQ